MYGEQDFDLHPILPDPVSQGWIREEDGLKPLLSKVQIAHEAVVELAKYSCSTTKKNQSSKCVSAILIFHTIVQTESKGNVER